LLLGLAGTSGKDLPISGDLSLDNWEATGAWPGERGGLYARSEVGGQHLTVGKKRRLGGHGHSFSTGLNLGCMCECFGPFLGGRRPYHFLDSDALSSGVSSFFGLTKEGTASFFG
jgi:hypothetical protein